MKRPFEHDTPHLNPTKTPNAVVTAWCAAFWEGEGSVAIVTGLQMNAGQKYAFCLERLKAYFGGKITYIKRTDSYLWQVCSYRAVDFINAIWKHLSPQRRAQIANKLQSAPAHLRKELTEEVLAHVFTT